MSIISFTYHSNLGIVHKESFFRIATILGVSVSKSSDKPYMIEKIDSYVKSNPIEVLEKLCVKELAQEFDGKVLVGKVNVDDEPELARRFGVMTIPTVVFLKNGQEFDRKVGVMPPQAFSGVLDTNL